MVDWLHAQLEKGMYWKIIAQTEEWTDVLKEKQKMFSFSNLRPGKMSEMSEKFLVKLFCVN